jgi:hypothetical protein
VGNSKLGFHLNVTTSISRNKEGSTESFGLEIEICYIDENLRQTMSNGGIVYRSRFFNQNYRYHIKDYTSKLFGDEPEPRFSMKMKRSLMKTDMPTSPEFDIHIEIIPNQQQL